MAVSWKTIPDFFTADSGNFLSSGAGLLGGIFGEGKTNMLSNLLSQFSGAKSTSISSLLSMAVPAILAMLGKHASTNNLSSDGLASMLAGQKGNIASAMPAGLNVGSLFESMEHRAAAPVAAATHSRPVQKNVHADTHHYASDADDNAGGGLKILFPIILLALLGAAAWYFFKDGCGGPKEVEHTSTGTHSDTSTVHSAGATMVNMAPGKLDSISGDFIYDAGESSSINLPNNAGVLAVGRNSTEYKLVNFLNDKNAMIDTAKGNWFEFTNVRFKTNAAEITEESLAQLKNLVTISKAYPSAQFKIGGYTDNSGNAANNLTLSQKRADAVAAKLKELGMPANALESAKGYGPEWPIADNATAEGRAQNRRVAVNVKSK